MTSLFMGVDDGVDISPTKPKQRTLSYDSVAIAIGSWGKKDEKPKMLPFLLSSFSVQPKGSPLMAYRRRGGTDYGHFLSRFQKFYSQSHNNPNPNMCSIKMFQKLSFLEKMID